MLDDALILVIPGSAIQDMNSSDLDNLLETYDLTEKSRNAFLNQEITFDEYIQLLESAQLNVDSYMKTVESNLEALQLL